jgi:hypothetical protein
MLMVPETPEIAASAEVVAMTSRRVTPKSITAPPEFRLDESWAPVPIEAEPTFAKHLPATSFFATAPAPVAPTSGGKWHVVRGVVDSTDLDALHEATKLPDDSPRLFADPEIGLFPTCGGNPPVGTAADVRRLLGLGRLQSLGLDGRHVAVAVVDTGINLEYLRSLGVSPTLDAHLSWSPLRTIKPGSAPVDHGTMCAYDILIAAPQATLLDYAVLQSTRRGGSAMAGVLSDAVIAYGGLLRMMRLPDHQRHYQSLVVSNSWGMFHPSWDFPPGNPGRYADNPRHPFNIIVGSLAAAGADILFAAGNCGPGCPDPRCQGVVTNTITGANSHPAVITVAGVDTNDDLVGYSSRGPGVEVLDPRKPDIATYTHFLGSEVFGAGAPDSGTSAACPVMAGLVAAVRSVVPFSNTNANRTSAKLKQFMLNNATMPAGKPPGWNVDFGRGIASGAGLDAAPTLLP